MVSAGDPKRIKSGNSQIERSQPGRRKYSNKWECPRGSRVKASHTGHIYLYIHMLFFCLLMLCGVETGVRVGPVAALDGLKNENFCCDHNILINPAAKCPSATLSATVHPLSVSDAEELSLKPLEALERRKYRPLTTHAEHALREVDLAIVLGRHIQQSDGSHCTTACTTIECNGPRLV